MLARSPVTYDFEEADQNRSGSTSQVQALAVGCVCVLALAADRADVGVQSAGGGKCLLLWAVFKQANKLFAKFIWVSGWCEA